MPGEGEQNEAPRGRIARSMVRGSAALAVQRGVEIVVGLFIVPFTLAHLGTDGYGLWALFFAVTAYFNLADFGFGASLNRYFTVAFTSGDRTWKYQVFSTALLSMILIALFLFLAGLAVERWVLAFFPQAGRYGDTAAWVWRALLAVLAMGYLTNYGRALMIAGHRVPVLAMFQAGYSLLNATMIIFVLSSGWGLIGLAAGSVVTGAVRLVAAFALGAGGADGWVVGLGGVNGKTLGTLWRFGLQVQAARFADMINQQFDRVLIGRVLGLGSVTAYDVGAKAASVGSQVPQIMNYVVEPAAAAFSTQGDEARFASLLRRSGKYFALASLPLAAYLSVAAEPLLALWLGRAPGAPMVLALRVLAWAYLVGTLTFPLRLCARGAGRPGWEAKTSGVQAVLNVVLSIGLYYLFGFPGVLAGTLAASLVGQTLLTRAVLTGLRQPAGRFLREAWLGPLAASLAGAAGGIAALGFFAEPAAGRLSALPQALAAGGVFLAVTLGVLIAFRVLPRAELRDLAGLLFRRGS